MSVYTIPKTIEEEDLSVLEVPPYVRNARIFSFVDLMHSCTCKIDKKELSKVNTLLEQAYTLIRNKTSDTVLFSQFDIDFTAACVVRYDRGGRPDEVTINSFIGMMELIETQTICVTGGKPKVAYFYPWYKIFENIKNQKWNTLSSYVACQCPTNPLFDYEKLIIVHQLRPGHWVFYTIFIKWKVIYYYDSLNRSPIDEYNPNILLKWIEMLASLAGNDFDAMEWRIRTAKCPSQVSTQKILR